MKDGPVFYSDYSKPEDFCYEAWSTLQMSLISTKNLPPDIIPTIIDTIKLNPKISLQELAGLTGKSKRTIQRIIKNSDQIKKWPWKVGVGKLSTKDLINAVVLFFIFLTNEEILLKLNCTLLLGKL